MSRLRVCFATAEFSPLAAVGGLAEATSGLVRELARAGDVEVDLVLPDYGDVELGDETRTVLDVPDWVGEATRRQGHHPDAGRVSLLAVPGMAREHPYVDARGLPWPDNETRFLAFSAAVAAHVGDTGPDLVHLNDWHTAATPAFLGSEIPVVLTIHSLAYQGVTDGSWLTRLPRAADAFEWWGATNPLAGGVTLADRVIAVSPRYAAEILTPEGGMGLGGRLSELGDRLVGIRNGIDTTVWDPSTDPLIATTYRSPDDPGKAACRHDLSTRVGFPADTTPVVGMVGRLVHQKGVDLVLGITDFLEHLPARLVVLGRGEPDLAAELRRLATDRPDRIWFDDVHDPGMAHCIFAGSDLFCMPSRFEPSGLAQMQAMAYGTIPVVTPVGGLADTVLDADGDRQAGTGFVAARVDTAGVVDALHRAVRAARHPARRTAIARRGMTTDWSWRGPAARHVELYRSLTSS